MSGSKDNGDDWKNSNTSDPYNKDIITDESFKDSFAQDNFKSNENEPWKESGENIDDDVVVITSEDDKAKSFELHFPSLKKEPPPAVVDPRPDALIRCALVTGFGAVQGLMLGFAFTAVSETVKGVFQGYHRYPGFRQQIFATSRRGGAGLAVWLGVYLGSRCTFRHLRKTDTDNMLTIFSSAGLAGAVTALGTRNIKLIGSSAIISGLTMCIFNMLGPQ